MVSAPGEAREDWVIVQQLARAMGSDWSYQSSKEILEEINALTPQYAGITHQRIQAGERLQWPCPSVDHTGTSYLHKDRFVRGKGLFSAVEHTDAKELPDGQYPFVLMAGRTL